MAQGEPRDGWMEEPRRRLRARLRWNPRRRDTAALVEGSGASARARASIPATHGSTPGAAPAGGCVHPVGDTSRIETAQGSAREPAVERPGRLFQAEVKGRRGEVAVGG